MPDPNTIALYDREAAGYADRVAGEAESPWLSRFAAALPAGGRVLDLGCGPGWAAARFRDLGFAVDALDASPGLAAEAARRYGVRVRVADFADLDADGAYDGVWASFSLLHAPRAEMPAHLARIARALRPGGTFYLGLKEGVGAARDSLGRLYTYWGAEEIGHRLAEGGFTVSDWGREESLGFDGTPAQGLHIQARRG